MIRGGISVIWKGYAEVYNKFLKSYDGSKSTSYIIYLDVSNLYGYSMMQLPLTEIFSVNPKDFNLDNYSNDSPIDCFSEVDLDYLEKLHDLHNDYPLSSEKIEVTEGMLHKYQLHIIKYNDFSFGKNTKTYP